MTVPHIDVDHILLKRGIGAPPSLKDAELALGQDENALYMRVAPSDILRLPLDVIAKPPTPNLSTVFLVKNGPAAEYDAFRLGGGGRAFDGAPWRVPGFTPTGFQVSSYAAGAVHYGLFEMPVAATVTSFRLDLPTNPGVVTYGIARWQDGRPGEIVFVDTVSGTGVQTPSVSVDLVPDCYCTFVQGSEAFSAQVITGFMRAGRLYGDAHAGYVAATGAIGLVGSTAPDWTALTDPYQHALVMGF